MRIAIVFAELSLMNTRSRTAEAVVDGKLVRLSLWTARARLPAVPRFWLLLGFDHDFDPLCYEECVPQQAPQHPDGVKHRFLIASAYPHDDHLAGFLP